MATIYLCETCNHTILIENGVYNKCSICGADTKQIRKDKSGKYLHHRNDGLKVWWTRMRRKYGRSIA